MKKRIFKGIKKSLKVKGDKVIDKALRKPILLVTSLGSHHAIFGSPIPLPRRKNEKKAN